MGGSGKGSEVSEVGGGERRISDSRRLLTDPRPATRDLRSGTADRGQGTERGTSHNRTPTRQERCCSCWCSSSSSAAGVVRVAGGLSFSYAPAVPILPHVRVSIDLACATVADKKGHVAAMQLPRFENNRGRIPTEGRQDTCSIRSATSHARKRFGLGLAPFASTSADATPPPTSELLPTLGSWSLGPTRRHSGLQLASTSSRPLAVTLLSILTPRRCTP